MPATKFREQPKTRVTVQMPHSIFEALHARTGAEHRSYSELTSLALAKHLKLDPADFGIEEKKANRAARRGAKAGV